GCSSAFDPIGAPGPSPAGDDSAGPARYHAGSPPGPAHTRPPSRRGSRTSLNRFAKLAVAASIATYVLIVVGGLVRATDSGLGCPDWPLCFGEWTPRPELHAWLGPRHRPVR